MPNEMPPRTTRRTQAERRETTRVALMAAARRLFGERGFAAVSIEEIASEAGVTRGALYHHFDSKEALFGALFEALEQELVGRALKAATAAANPWESLRHGARAFLEGVSETPTRRIVLLDAPAVLGWEKWREIDLRYGLGALKAALKAAMDAGAMQERPIDPLAHMLLGALTEAAMMIGPETSREVAADQFDALLESLR
jgi:AcrR family transcriptional regulator